MKARLRGCEIALSLYFLEIYVFALVFANRLVRGVVVVVALRAGTVCSRVVGAGIWLFVSLGEGIFSPIGEWIKRRGVLPSICVASKSIGKQTFETAHHPIGDNQKQYECDKAHILRK